jgi:hypothetical protein
MNFNPAGMSTTQLQSRIAHLHKSNQQLDLMMRDLENLSPGHPQVAAWEMAKLSNTQQIQHLAEALAEKMTAPSGVERSGPKFGSAGQFGHPGGRYSQEHHRQHHPPVEHHQHPAGQWGYRPVYRTAYYPDNKAQHLAGVRYGHVQFADPVNQKYPINTPEHIRAAWAYIHEVRNSNKYSNREVHEIENRIIHAWCEKIDPRGPPGAR